MFLLRTYQNKKAVWINFFLDPKLRTNFLTDMLITKARTILSLDTQVFRHLTPLATSGSYVLNTSVELGQQYSNGL